MFRVAFGSIRRRPAGTLRTASFDGRTTRKRLDKRFQLAAVVVRHLIRIEAALGALASEDVDDDLAVFAGQLADVVDAPEPQRDVRRETLEEREEAGAGSWVIIGMSSRLVDMGRDDRARNPAPSAPSGR